MLIAIIVLVLILAVSIYFNIEFALKLLQVEDLLEECLDVIDEKYSRISEILARPLFFDSPEVRRVVEDIRDARNALHRVAFSLSKNFMAEEKEKGENVREEKN